MFLSLLLTVICYSTGVLSLNLFSPCKITDLKCQEKSINIALPQLFAGNPGLGVESSDPLFIEEIVGDLSGLKYKFVNSTFTGGKNAFVANIKVDKNLTKSQFDLIFPKTSLSGIYEISGKLLSLPVEGSGDYLLTIGKYIMNIDSEFEKIKGEDGKTHISIKKFKLKCNPLEPVTYEFKNLFNGQKDLSDAAHKFANENWLEVTELLQDPACMAGMTKIFHNFNEYLKHTTLEDFIVEA